MAVRTRTTYRMSVELQEDTFVELYCDTFVELELLTLETLLILGLVDINASHRAKPWLMMNF